MDDFSKEAQTRYFGQKKIISILDSAWNYQSKVIRLEALGVCRTCGRRHEPLTLKLNAGHMIHTGYGYNILDFNLLLYERNLSENIYCQCSYCNLYDNGAKDKMKQRFFDSGGTQDEYDEMMTYRHKSWDPTREEAERIRDFYKNKFKKNYPEYAIKKATGEKRSRVMTITRKQAREIADKITNKQLSEMFAKAKESIRDWTIPSIINKNFTLGSAWNILYGNFNVAKAVPGILKMNMVREFGRFLPTNFFMTKKGKSKAEKKKPHHEEPIF